MLTARRTCFSSKGRPEQVLRLPSPPSARRCPLGADGPTTPSGLPLTLHSASIGSTFEVATGASRKERTVGAHILDTDIGLASCPTLRPAGVYPRNLSPPGITLPISASALSSSLLVALRAAAASRIRILSKTSR